MNNINFLHEKINNNDLILVNITNSPSPQVLTSKIEKIYSTKHGIKKEWTGKEIDFIHAPRVWGNTPLKVGETSLVFIKSISGKLYEDSWHGHMVIEKIENTLYAIFPYRELWLSDTIPNSIKISSRQDPKRPYATAIESEEIIKYLCNLIEIGK